MPEAARLDLDHAYGEGNWHGKPPEQLYHEWLQQRSSCPLCSEQHMCAQLLNIIQKIGRLAACGSSMSTCGRAWKEQDLRQMQCICMNILLHCVAEECLRSDHVLWWLEKCQWTIFHRSCEATHWTGHMYLNINYLTEPAAGWVQHALNSNRSNVRSSLYAVWRIAQS